MRKPVRAIFENIDKLSKDDVVKSDILKDLVKKQIPAAIEEALIDKKIYASIFEINDSGQYVEIHKNHWVQSLEACLVWYVEEENYEMCTHIKNMIQTIQKKPRPSKVTIDKKKVNGKGV